jgi:outer membrane protein TolC
MKKTAGVPAILALAVLAAVPFPSGAQDTTSSLTLTLDDCLELALRQNPLHQAVLERESQARASKLEATSRFLPTVNVQGTSTLAEKLFVLEFPSMIPGEPSTRIEIDFTRDYQTTMNFSLPLFTGGALRAGYRQAGYGVQASQEGSRRSEHNTVYRVRQAFYGVLLAREFHAVSLESLDLAEQHLRDVKNLYEVGMASKFDLLRAEVQVANLKPQVIKARNSLDISELGLKTLLGIDVEKPVVFQGTLAFAPLQAELEKSVDEALAARPEIHELDYQRQMAGEMLKVAQSAYWPTLAVGGAVNWWADALNLRKNTWQSFYAVNLVLSLPVLNVMETRARVAQSRSALKELEWTRKGLTETVKAEVRQAILNYGQARESLLSQEKNVEQALEAVRIAELNYGEGVATSLDVTTARVALSQARTNLAQALYDCVMSQAEFERAIGRGWPGKRLN